MSYSFFENAEPGLASDVQKIRHKMLRAVADLRQLAAQQSDPAKAMEEGFTL